jgi:hypothetical protein
MITTSYPITIYQTLVGFPPNHHLRQMLNDCVRTLAEHGVQKESTMPLVHTLRAGVICEVETSATVVAQTEQAIEV